MNDKSPASFLPRAESLLDGTGKLGSKRHLDVAQYDQWQAALSETESVLDWYRAVMGRRARHSTKSPHVVAWALALQAAADRAMAKKGSSHCTHVHNGNPVALTAIIDQRIVACQRCLLEILLNRPMVKDNGKCDVCDTPSVKFTPIACDIGAVVVLANCCRVCVQWMSDMALVIERAA